MQKEFFPGEKALASPTARAHPPPGEKTRGAF